MTPKIDPELVASIREVCAVGTASRRVEVLLRLLLAEAPLNSVELSPDDGSLGSVEQTIRHLKVSGMIRLATHPQPGAPATYTLTPRGRAIVAGLVAIVEAA